MTVEEKNNVQRKVTDYKDSQKSTTTTPFNAVFLPDVSMRVDTNRDFYELLLLETQKLALNLTILDMPNVHEYNTKRFEVKWLSYMRNELALEDQDLVIAHGMKSKTSTFLISTFS